MAGSGECANLVLLASGRDADVYALSDDTVLRRYRDGGDVSAETSLMRHLRRAGYPTPLVHRAGGPDLVMDRLYGPSLAEATVRGDVDGDACAAILADLLARLHRVPHPGGGGVVAHLDLHPENVICTDDGPQVIDWRNARAGTGGLDVAMTAVILAQIAVDEANQRHAGTREVLSALLRRTRENPLPYLHEALALRGRDPALTADEVGRLGGAGRLIRALAPTVGLAASTTVGP